VHVLAKRDGPLASSIDVSFVVMGNKYGVSPFDILELLGPMFVVGPMLVWLVVIGPLLIYPIARWKANRDGIVDPQLGLKVALHYFALIAFQLALFAATMILYTLFSKSQLKGELYRVGFAFLIPAGGVLAAHLVLLQRTNQDHYTGVRRLYLGYNLLVTGLLGFASLLLAFQLFFKKGSAGDGGRLAIAAVLVYVGAWVACGVQFFRLVLGAPGDPGATLGPPSHAAPPVQAPPQPSGPTLPSLSAGTYPPIDQK
jgi:hypothetical protein